MLKLVLFPWLEQLWYTLPQCPLAAKGSKGWDRGYPPFCTHPCRRGCTKPTA